MQRMLQGLRRRLGRPVETALALLDSRWRTDLVVGLKERLLQRLDLQAPANPRGSGTRLSPEAVMQLYVVRHGIAVDSSEGMPDEWRPLTDKGRRRFRKTARAFGKLDRPLDLILTSPLLRAVQTAEILAIETGQDEVGIVAELDPKFGVEAVRSAVASRAGDVESVAIVGHEP